MIDLGEVETPIGRLRFAQRDGELCALTFSDDWPRLDRRLDRRFGTAARAMAPVDGVSTALRAYFDGDLAALEGIEVDPGGTRFQRAVWRALRRIPPGQTDSYGDVARRVRAPAAVRAVGTAAGANPVGIVIPCHRVIRSDGDLGGYAAGVERKRWLLEHERRHA